MTASDGYERNYNHTGPGLDVPPEDRLGVYKTVEDIPPRSRLADKGKNLPHDDPWKAYMDSKSEMAETTRDKYDRVERVWKEHMADEDRHYACPHPDDVIEFFEEYGQLTFNTLYHSYFVQLNGFFRFMMNHTDYPHLHSPLYMAAAKNDRVRTVYSQKL